MAQKKVEALIKQVAEQHNIPYDVVKAVFESQFYCARLAIKKALPENLNSFPTIRFRRLGTLTPKINQIIKLQEKNERDNSCNQD